MRQKYYRRVSIPGLSACYCERVQTGCFSQQFALVRQILFQLSYDSSCRGPCRSAVKAWEGPCSSPLPPQPFLVLASKYSYQPSHGRGLAGKNGIMMSPYTSRTKRSFQEPPRLSAVVLRRAPAAVPPRRPQPHTTSPIWTPPPNTMHRRTDARRHKDAKQRMTLAVTRQARRPAAPLNHTSQRHAPARRRVASAPPAPGAARKPAAAAAAGWPTGASCWGRPRAPPPAGTRTARAPPPPPSRAP